jgi:hypothetical protein
MSKYDDAAKKWSDACIKMWDDYEGFKVAFGEDNMRTTIDARGHQWKEIEIYNGCYSGRWPQRSLQQCEVCDHTREVMLHPGIAHRGWNNKGHWGMPSIVVVKSCVEVCEGEVK